MKILVTGVNGQLGSELLRRAPMDVEVVGLCRDQIDISDAGAVSDTIRSLRPAWIVNAAAYSLVDKAESEPQQAHLVNAEAPAHLARAARDIGARMLHISTDFVFDGRQGSPYLPGDDTRPLGVYGQSKQLGEQRVVSILGENALIIRTAWLHSRHGRNFVKTMLKLLSEREEIRVVADQIGTPTWAADLANVAYRAMAKQLNGIHHWTDAGVASWYDFAMAIQEIGLDLGLLKRAIPIAPIPTEAYPTPAMRPHYSVLDKESLRTALGYTGLYWRDALKHMMQELIDG